MKKLVVILMMLLMMAFKESKFPRIKITYPAAKKCDTIDNYFGVEVTDPYRWLEDENSADTKIWIQAENKLTADYLNQIPFRTKIRESLIRIMDFEKITVPFKKGGKLFFYRNSGLQNQNVLFMKESPESADERVILNPDSLSNDGTVSVIQAVLSKNGRWLAFSVSRYGSDWTEIFVRDIATGKDLPDHLVNIKRNSNIAWYQEGFYYSWNRPLLNNQENSGHMEYQMIYYHKVGTDQKSDSLIFQYPIFARSLFFAETTEDEKYLVISQGIKSRGQIMYLKDLTDKKSELNRIYASLNYQSNLVDITGNKLIVLTNKNAPNSNLVSIDLSNSPETNWKPLIPESGDLLNWCKIAGNKIIAGYLTDAHSTIKVFKMNGEFESELSLPGIGTVSSFECSREEPIAYYQFASFINPGMIFKYDVNTNISEVYYQTRENFDAGKFITDQAYYYSKDSTKIHMFIVHRKDIVLNGENPVLLTGYGGFNYCMTPYFSPSQIIWLENGGLFALPNLRGDGEYGEEWHQAGTKILKQNVFNDFIAAAEYLIKEKYTSAEYLTISGASNGGLLIAAVVNQRPDLFAVAVPEVGLMDMLRYQRFTSSWTGEYGTSDNKDEFKYLNEYSPVHNIREGLPYPAVFVTTGDHDDRVVPSHSYKYAATLQEKYKGENPVLIRVAANEGHGEGQTIMKRIDEQTDMWSFAFYNMNIIDVGTINKSDNLKVKW
ncbi:MAG: prolyl oligopeptidase family serine peptidase [Bacteroidia bacterium]|nr:prolyl oligopeptidase family serine peptidase [Bacteroidia bacterium]